MATWQPLRAQRPSKTLSKPKNHPFYVDADRKEELFLQAPKSVNVVVRVYLKGPPTAAAIAALQSFIGDSTPQGLAQQLMRAQHHAASRDAVHAFLDIKAAPVQGSTRHGIAAGGQLIWQAPAPPTAAEVAARVKAAADKAASEAVKDTLDKVKRKHTKEAQERAFFKKLQAQEDAEAKAAKEAQERAFFKAAADAKAKKLRQEKAFFKAYAAEKKQAENTKLLKEEMAAEKEAYEKHKAKNEQKTKKKPDLSACLTEEDHWGVRCTLEAVEQCKGGVKESRNFVKNCRKTCCHVRSGVDYRPKIIEPPTHEEASENGAEEAMKAEQAHLEALAKQTADAKKAQAAAHKASQQAKEAENAPVDPEETDAKAVAMLRDVIAAEEEAKQATEEVAASRSKVVALKAGPKKTQAIKELLALEKSATDKVAHARALREAYHMNTAQDGSGSSNNTATQAVSADSADSADEVVPEATAVPTCPKGEGGETCSGPEKGKCHSDKGHCECSGHWRGPACDKPCPQNAAGEVCNAHGMCTAAGRCACTGSYDGEGCTELNRELTLLTQHGYGTMQGLAEGDQEASEAMYSEGLLQLLANSTNHSVDRFKVLSVHKHGDDGLKTRIRIRSAAMTQAAKKAPHPTAAAIAALEQKIADVPRNDIAKAAALEEQLAGWKKQLHWHEMLQAKIGEKSGQEATQRWADAEADAAAKAEKKQAEKAFHSEEEKRKDEKKFFKKMSEPRDSKTAKEEASQEAEKAALQQQMKHEAEKLKADEKKAAAAAKAEKVKKAAAEKKAAAKEKAAQAKADRKAAEEKHKHQASSVEEEEAEAEIRALPKGPEKEAATKALKGLEADDNQLAKINAHKKAAAERNAAAKAAVAKVAAQKQAAITAAADKAAAEQAAAKKKAATDKLAAANKHAADLKAAKTKAAQAKAAEHGKEVAEAEKAAEAHEAQKAKADHAAAVAKSDKAEQRKVAAATEATKEARQAQEAVEQQEAAVAAMPEGKNKEAATKMLAEVKKDAKELAKSAHVKNVAAGLKPADMPEPAIKQPIHHHPPNSIEKKAADAADAVRQQETAVAAMPEGKNKEAAKKMLEEVKADAEKLANRAAQASSKAVQDKNDEERAEKATEEQAESKASEKDTEQAEDQAAEDKAEAAANEAHAAKKAVKEQEQAVAAMPEGSKKKAAQKMLQEVKVDAQKLDEEAKRKREALDNEDDTKTVLLQMADEIGANDVMEQIEEQAKDPDSPLMMSSVAGIDLSSLSEVKEAPTTPVKGALCDANSFYQCADGTCMPKGVSSAIVPVGGQCCTYNSVNSEHKVCGADPKNNKCAFDQGTYKCYWDGWNLKASNASHKEDSSSAIYGGIFCAILLMLALGAAGGFLYLKEQEMAPDDLEGLDTSETSDSEEDEEKPSLWQKCFGPASKDELTQPLADAEAGTGGLKDEDEDDDGPIHPMYPTDNNVLDRLRDAPVPNCKDLDHLPSIFE